jgi:hypothetical protein
MSSKVGQADDRHACGLSLQAWKVIVVASSG